MMYFDDYEPYIEPSAADQIIASAMAEIEASVVEEAKQRLSEVAVAQERLEALDCEIREKERKAAELEKKLAKLEETTVQAYRDVPKRYVDALVRKATGGLAPGDVIWVLKGERRKCERCGGAKKLTVTDKTGRDFSITCPDCCGVGTIHTPRCRVEQQTVQEVQLKLCFEQDRVNYWDLECISFDEYSYEKFDPARMFMTQESALAALAKEGG